MSDEAYMRRPETKQAGQWNSSRGSIRDSISRATFTMERAEVLFGSYRRADANDPVRYVAAIAAVLSLYEPEIMIEVTDPRTGIQNTDDFKTFMPQSGELKRYCDGVAAVRDRIRKMAAWPAPDPNRMRLAAPVPMPGDKATVLVPKENPRYPALVEWAKTADERLWKFDPRGVWVSWDTWDSRSVAARMGARSNGLGPLTLSEDARRAMADIDAQRNGDLPCDHPTDAYQEAESR